MTVDRRLYGIVEPELPWLFFQRVCEDGRLELRSPSGFARRVHTIDICDFLAGDPVVLRAMPRAVFSERLRLPLGERQRNAHDEAYQPAYVRWVSKDRWERVDARYQFLDESLNHGDGDFINPVHDADRHLLESKATRAHMPDYDCRAMRGGSSTADRRVEASNAFGQAVAQGLVQSALKGRDVAVSAHAAFEVKPFKRAGLNRLMSDARV